LKELRHYSATELLTGGVDLRTVAGRLGHGDDTTTQCHYAAWVGSADQAAGSVIGGRRPTSQFAGAVTTEVHRVMSRLAMEAARRLGAGFADGARFVELAPVSAADSVAAFVARGLGLSPRPGS
jgi:hypothetical protein